MRIIAVGLMGMAVAASGSTITKDGQYLVSGATVLTMSSFVGTTSGVLVDLGSGAVPSGDAVLTLDPSEISTELFNFSSGSIAFDENLLLTFPLQAALNQPPIPIHLVEIGTLPAFNLATSGQLTFFESHTGTISQPLLPDQATVGSSTGTFTDQTGPTLSFAFDPAFFTGGGTVTAGLFAGFGYHNDQEGDNPSLTLGTHNNTSIAGPVQVIVVNFPEPQTAHLVVLGASFVLAVRSFRGWAR